jgi:hypothetical protein
MLKKTTLAMAIIASGIAFTAPANADSSCSFCTCIKTATTYPHYPSCIAIPPNQGTSSSPIYNYYTVDSCKSSCDQYNKDSNNSSCDWPIFSC